MFMRTSTSRPEARSLQFVSGPGLIRVFVLALIHNLAIDAAEG